MKRGEVYEARLEPVEGSEQGGIRPVIIISRDAINKSSPLVVIVPVTTFTESRRIYPSQIVIKAPAGGLKVDSVVLGEQLRAISKTRLLNYRGILDLDYLQKLNKVLKITLDLSL